MPRYILRILTAPRQLHPASPKAPTFGALSPASLQSWQRGLNENTNGLLRQYWPKITDFKKVSKKDVSSVIVQLNNRPRKTLNYQMPSTLMANHMAAFVA